MQEWKASEKEAQKMTRDGAISVNLVTGEATHISDRPPEQDYSSADETAGALNRAADEVVGHRERRQTKKARRKRRDTFREGEAARDRPSSRLQFSETDQAAPELKKAIRKSDKAADRLDAAKAAVPVKPPGKEHGNPLSRPVQEIRSTLHGEVSKVEGDNSGVQAGHLGERQIEKAVGYGNRRFHQARADRKLKPWRDVKQAEQAAVKANADFYWRKSVMENPQLASSNPISRLWQKKRLQKQYAAAHRAGTGAAQAAGKTSQTAASAAKKGGGTIAQKLGGLVTKNKHTLLIVGGIGLILMLIMGLMQSCTSMFGGGTSGLVASSYVKEIDPGLHALQAEVGGDIAASYPFDDPVGLVLNDEGKLIGLDLNRSLRDEHGEIYDIVAGTFLVVGLGPESFASLPPDMIQKYTEQFKRPELFASINGQIVSVPVEPENPLRTAEMTLEDDYGMIDGIINNGRRGEELEKAQAEARRTTPEKKPSIRERLEDAKRECAERKSPDKPAPQKKPPELGDL